MIVNIVAWGQEEPAPHLAHEEAPSGARSPSGATSSHQWAWVELNYRPHAYQAAQARNKFRRHYCKSMTDRAIRPDCLPRVP